MSLSALAWALRVDPGHPTHKLLLVILADRARYERMTDADPVAEADHELLSRLTGASLRQTQRGVVALRELGYLSTQHVGAPDGGRAPNRYVLHVDRQDVVSDRGGSAEGLTAR